MTKNGLIAVCLFILLGFVGCGDGVPSNACIMSGVAGGKSVDPCVEEELYRIDGASGVSAQMGNVLAVSVGDAHACALLTDHTVKCWGRNSHGEVGDGTMIDQLSPVDVPGMTNVAKIVALPSEMTCAILADSTMACWGYEADWPVEFLREEPMKWPVVLSGVTNVKNVAGGYGHACALTIDGTVTCWGDCSAGQCGDGIVDVGHHVNVSPTVSEYIADAVDISAHDEHTCVLYGDGHVACLGAVSGINFSGFAYRSTPEVIRDDQSQVISFTQIASGQYADFGATTDGALLGWGMNEYCVFGDGTCFNSDIPIPAIDIFNPRNFSAGYSHTCSVMPDDAIWCWGNNGYGEFGDGTIMGSTEPRETKTIAGVKAVSAGRYFTCAVTIRQNVYCWGLNDHGQLGNGTTTDSLLPILVNGL